MWQANGAVIPIAQLVEHATEKPGTIVMQVQVPDIHIARDLSPSQISMSGVHTAARVQSHASTATRR